MRNCNIIAVIILLCIPGFIVIPAAASDDRCTLTVLSIPDKAAVTIDGTLIGSAPLSGYELSCDSHTVSVSAKGYADYVVEKTLLRGNPEVIIANLGRLEDRGTVSITTDPDGGDLYIDGALKGTTPHLVDALIDDIAGHHAVAVGLIETLIAGPTATDCFSAQLD